MGRRDSGIWMVSGAVIWLEGVSFWWNLWNGVYLRSPLGPGERLDDWLILVSYPVGGLFVSWSLVLSDELRVCAA